MKAHKGLSGEDERMGVASHLAGGRKRDEGSGMQGMALILGVLLLITVLVNTYFVMQTHSLTSNMQSMIMKNTAAVQRLSADADSKNPSVATTSRATATTAPATDNQKVSLIVLNDARCKECMTAGESIVEQLKAVFPGIDSKEVDYSTDEGKNLYKETNVKYLPALLFSDDVKTSKGYAEVQSYLVSAGNYLSLKIGADYDPTAEVDCGNGVDDNGDGLVDCKDPTCTEDISCAKKDTPVVEAFVMAQCPYGLQIEKGLIPVVKALGGSIDFSVKFCDYAMHGKKELDEQMLQYCIERDYKDKYLTYLECYVKEGNTANCLKEADIDTAKVEKCVNDTDAKYKVTESFNDKSTWVGGNYPPFNVYKDLTTKYNVQGSPTFVVNGVVMDRVARDPQSLMDAICKGFTIKPAACDQKLDNATPSPGFGTATMATGTDTAAAACAT